MNFADECLKKAAESLYEAGKITSQSFFATILLLCLTAILSFSKELEGTVAIPETGLQLPRLHAAQVAVVLTCAWLFRTLSSLLVERRLFGELNRIWRTIDPKARPEWYYYYPSLFSSARASYTYRYYRLAPGRGSFAASVPYIGISAGFVGSTLLVFVLGNQARWDITAILTCSAATFLLLISVDIMIKNLVQADLELAQALSTSDIDLPKSTVPIPKVSYAPALGLWQLEEEYKYEDDTHNIPIDKGFTFDLAFWPMYSLLLVVPYEHSIVAPLLQQYLYVALFEGYSPYSRAEIDSLIMQIMIKEGVARWRAELIYLFHRLYGGIFLRLFKRAPNKQQ